MFHSAHYGVEFSCTFTTRSKGDKKKREIKGDLEKSRPLSPVSFLTILSFNGAVDSCKRIERISPLK